MEKEEKMSFIDGIKAKAKQNIKTIILPESEDERTIRAAAKVLEDGLAKIILIGNENTIRSDAAKYGVDMIGKGPRISLADGIAARRAQMARDTLIFCSSFLNRPEERMRCCCGTERGGRHR